MTHPDSTAVWPGVPPMVVARCSLMINISSNMHTNFVLVVKLKWDGNQEIRSFLTGIQGGKP